MSTDSNTVREQFIAQVGTRLDEQARDLGALYGQMSAEAVPSYGVVPLHQALAILREDLPPPSEHAADVITDARLVVWARCPSCSITTAIAVHITPQLVVDASGSTVKLQFKTRSAMHICGQMVMQSGPETEIQTVLPLEDGDEDGVEAPTEADEVRDEVTGEIIARADSTAADDYDGGDPDAEAVRRLERLAATDGTSDLEPTSIAKPRGRQIRCRSVSNDQPPIS